MADFQDEKNRVLFGNFLLKKMQLKHQTIESFAADLSMETQTLRRYLDGTFPPQKLSNIYRLMEYLDVEFSEFETFLSEQSTGSKKTSSHFNAMSGPTININSSNSFDKCPIGTQGNVIFNQNDENE